MAGGFAVAYLVFARVAIREGVHLVRFRRWRRLGSRGCAGRMAAVGPRVLGEGRLLRHGLLLHCTSVGAATAGAGRVRCLASSSNGRPVSVWMASFREKACQRLMATSTKRGSNSSV